MRKNAKKNIHWKNQPISITANNGWARKVPSNFRVGIKDRIVNDHLLGFLLIRLFSFCADFLSFKKVKKENVCLNTANEIFCFGVSSSNCNVQMLKWRFSVARQRAIFTSLYFIIPSREWATTVVLFAGRAKLSYR